MARTDALALLTVDLNVMKEIATVFFLLVSRVIPLIEVEAHHDA